MTTIDLTGAVAAALDTDEHWKNCPLLPKDCVFCREVADRIEVAVLAAAPVITSAVWSSRPDAEDGLKVWQQWAARKPHNTIVRSRDTEEEARAFAYAWGYELIVRDAYTGTSDWRLVEDFSKPRKPTDG